LPTGSEVTNIQDHARYLALCATASEGNLNEQELTELEEYLEANDWLAVMKAKAWASLPPNKRTA
jgi:hypothetical protein